MSSLRTVGRFRLAAGAAFDSRCHLRPPIIFSAQHSCTLFNQSNHYAEKVFLTTFRQFSYSSPSQAGVKVPVNTNKNRPHSEAAPAHANDEESPNMPPHHDDPFAPVDTDFLKRKDWISNGFDEYDREIDNLKFHGWMFLVIGFIAFIAFGNWYKPEPQGQDWTSREAYLELSRRERLGLPLVDPDLIPRSRIVLPSEEELGDFQIYL